MSAVVPESLQRTAWSDPLQLRVIAPQPNATRPDQRPARWLRPPRLPEPPPLVGDLSMLSSAVVMDTVAAGAAVAEEKGSALVNAAIENFKQILGNSSESPRRELLHSRLPALPVRNLRRVERNLRRVDRKPARVLLQYQEDSSTELLTGAEAQMNPVNPAKPAKLMPNTTNTTHDPSWSASLSTDLENLDGVQVGLAFALVVLFFIFTVGVFRGWWCKRNTHTLAESQGYDTFENEAVDKTRVKKVDYDI
jgi:hypothetical protein